MNGRAIDDGEKERFKPCSASFGERRQDYISGEWFEVSENSFDGRDELRHEPKAIDLAKKLISPPFLFWQRFQ